MAVAEVAEVAVGWRRWFWGGGGGGGGGGAGFGAGGGGSGVSKYASPPQIRAPPNKPAAAPAGTRMCVFASLLCATQPPANAAGIPQAAAAIAAFSVLDLFDIHAQPCRTRPTPTTIASHDFLSLISIPPFAALTTETHHLLNREKNICQ